MKILILALMLFNPIKPVVHALKVVGEVIIHPKRDFYAVTNFFVNHIQPNQKAKPSCH